MPGNKECVRAPAAAPGGWRRRHLPVDGPTFRPRSIGIWPKRMRNWARSQDRMTSAQCENEPSPSALIFLSCNHIYNFSFDLESRPEQPQQVIYPARPVLRLEPQRTLLKTLGWLVFHRNSVLLKNPECAVHFLWTISASTGKRIPTREARATPALPRRQSGGVAPHRASGPTAQTTLSGRNVSQLEFRDTRGLLSGLALPGLETLRAAARNGRDPRDRHAKPRPQLPSRAPRSAGPGPVDDVARARSVVTWPGPPSAPRMCWPSPACSPTRPRLGPPWPVALQKIRAASRLHVGVQLLKLFHMQ